MASTAIAVPKLKPVGLSQYRFKGNITLLKAQA
jgi:hypothetical protein